MDLRRNVGTGLLWPILFAAACGSSGGQQSTGTGGVSGVGGHGSGGSDASATGGVSGAGGSAGAGGTPLAVGGAGGAADGTAGHGGTAGGAAGGGTAGFGGSAGGAAGSAGAGAQGGSAAAGGAAGAPAAGGIGGAAGNGGRAGVGGHTTLTTNKLDILFMIDNSSSMSPLQQKMVDAFPSVLDGFKTNPVTGQPTDLHVAVVSSSYGGGAWTNVNQCATGAHPGDDQGIFQQGPGGARSGSCPALNAGETYLIAGDGGDTSSNFTGSLGDAFACLALLGDRGCGFESQFESVQAALTRAAMPKGLAPGGDPDNGGFLRSDARLVVVMLTNEDDCSVPFNSLLLYPGVNSTQDSSGLGALQSYRCNEFGHLCANPAGGPKVPPPHTIGLGVSVTLDGCQSAEDQGKTDLVSDPSGNPDPTMGHLVTVASFIDFLKSLKADPRDVFVAALDGPSTPYVVTGYTNPTNSEVDPEIMHSCTQAMGMDTIYADPAVRINQWVTAFGQNGFTQSICDDDLHGIFTALATAVHGS